MYHGKFVIFNIICEYQTMVNFLNSVICINSTHICINLYEANQKTIFYVSTSIYDRAIVF